MTFSSQNFYAFSALSCRGPYTCVLSYEIYETSLLQDLQIVFEMTACVRFQLLDFISLKVDSYFKT